MRKLIGYLLVAVIAVGTSSFHSTANAASVTLKRSGSCASSGNFLEGGKCSLSVASSTSFKNRKVELQSKEGTYGSWQSEGYWSLTSKGSLSVSITDDCTIRENNCDGLYKFRVVVLKSGSKPKVVTNEVSVRFVVKVTPPAPEPPKPEPPVQKYPLSSKSSIRQIVVDALAWYCSSVPTSALRVSTWTIARNYNPYSLWAYGSSGVIYLEVSGSSSSLVTVSADPNQISATGTYLRGWGCPSSMKVQLY